ncbi:amidohydrolase family protein [Methanobrevibacter filiformis]|uniref:5-methylthioadenosine/S-adenosylhomocysteine deaminase n=1 Tax=Methanobrevibacter filiformis TaxID=55758 RepID=A0A165Z5I2_9EURY|nr:amidohydrolase family protein [Methanobrevibacter filiformis]KZX10273.1 5-methylthioadenosine/S-adenosylhomocysteine deaminase [Methanobrevibacter filiformis]
MYTIKNGLVLYGIELEPKKSNILICEGEIIEISPDVCEGEVIDATGCLVCPSFLNAHTHIGDSFIKDIGDGKTIDEIVKPPNGLKHKAIGEADDDEVIGSIKRSMWDMLDSGTTHFIDYREGGIKGVKLLKKAAENIPITPIILGRDDIFYKKDESLSKVKIAIRKLLKTCDGIAPSGFGEISFEVAKLIAEECEKAGKISSIHVGEYEQVQKDSINKFGKTELNLAIDAEFDLLIHLTYPMKNDLDLILNKNNNKNNYLALCPGSNAILSLGNPPLVDILKKGIKPLIGTDNIMLNSPNLLREMNFILKISRALSKDYVSPKEILKMATTNIHVHDHYCHNHGSTLTNWGNDFNHNDEVNVVNRIVNKSIIAENQIPQLMIVKNISKNPYLNMINRVETKNILYLINHNNIIKNNILIN